MFMKVFLLPRKVYTGTRDGMAVVLERTRRSSFITGCSIPLWRQE